MGGPTPGACPGFAAAGPPCPSPFAREDPTCEPREGAAWPRVGVIGTQSCASRSAPGSIAPGCSGLGGAIGGRLVRPAPGGLGGAVGASWPVCGRWKGAGRRWATGPAWHPLRGHPQQGGAKRRRLDAHTNSFVSSKAKMIAQAGGVRLVSRGRNILIELGGEVGRCLGT